MIPQEDDEVNAEDEEMRMLTEQRMKVTPRCVLLFLILSSMGLTVVFKRLSQLYFIVFL